MLRWRSGESYLFPWATGAEEAKDVNDVPSMGGIAGWLDWCGAWKDRIHMVRTYWLSAGKLS